MRSVLIQSPMIALSLVASLALIAEPQDTVARRDSATTANSAVTAPSKAAQELERVRVSAAAKLRAGYTVNRTRSGTRTPTALRDIPQAVTVLGQPVLRDLNIQGMAKAVEYVPGMSMAQGEGHRDAPVIRGQASTADFFVDGVRDDAQYYRDTYNVEQLEALKGPNAMVFGRGGGGGVINRVIKQAEWMPVRELRLEGGSFDARRVQLDVGQSFGTRIAARVNALHDRGDSFRQSMDYERVGFNPTVSVTSGRTIIRAGYEHFTDRRVVDRGLPSANGRPAALAFNRFVGDPSASPATLAVNGAHVLVEFDNGHGLSLRSHLRGLSYDKFYQNVFPGSSVNAAGTQLNLAAYSAGSDRQSLFHQADATWTASRGGIRHVALVGTELSRQLTDNVRLTGFFNNTSTLQAVPVGATNVSLPITFRANASDPNNRATASVAAAFVQEQLHLGEHVQLLGGVRVDRFALDVRNNRTSSTVSRTDVLVSPRIGAVFSPVAAFNVYVSSSVSALPNSGDQFASLTATTQSLRPEVFRNNEVGVKWTARPALEVTGAFYRLARSNTISPDPLNPALLLQTGRQQSTGVEVGVAGAVTSRWDVVGGVAVQRARIASRTAAAREGASVPLVPQTTASLWNKVRLSAPLSLGVGVVHQTARYTSIDNAVTMPAFTRLDAGAFVTISRTLGVQLNVENAFNTRYFATAHNNNNIMPGAPRQFRLALRVGE